MQITLKFNPAALWGRWSYQSHSLIVGVRLLLNLLLFHLLSRKINNLRPQKPVAESDPGDGRRGEKEAEVSDSSVRRGQIRITKARRDHLDNSPKNVQAAEDEDA